MEACQCDLARWRRPSGVLAACPVVPGRRGGDDTRDTAGWGCCIVGYLGIILAFWGERGTMTEG